MIRVPIEYEPTNLLPCLTTRIRKETKAMDNINAEISSHKDKDIPIIYGKDPSGKNHATFFDMNPTASRLYREDMRQSQPYVVPTEDSEYIQNKLKLKQKIDATLDEIEELQQRPKLSVKDKELLEARQALYETLVIRQKQQGIDAIAQNPYFEKYDVATDSRNIVRELRSAVSEDVVNRGEKESQSLLRREMESRWLPQNFAEEKGLDTLSAYELMRPAFTNMEKTYR
jgi:hypothetical protein